MLTGSTGFVMYAMMRMLSPCVTVPPLGTHSVSEKLQTATPLTTGTEGTAVTSICSLNVVDVVPVSTWTS